MAKLNISGDLITRFVILCSNLADAQICIPSLTQEQFDKIHSQDAYLVGDSESGVEFRDDSTQED